MAVNGTWFWHAAIGRQPTVRAITEVAQALQYDRWLVVRPPVAIY